MRLFLGCYFLFQSLPKPRLYVVRESLRLHALVYLQRLLSGVYDDEAIGAGIHMLLPMLFRLRVYRFIQVGV